MGPYCGQRERNLVAYTISTDRWRSYDVSDPTNAVVLMHCGNPDAVESRLRLMENASIRRFPDGNLRRLRPANPIVLDSILTTPGQVASCVEVIDDTLYVLKNGELHIFELAFPLRPVEIGGGFADETMASRRIAKSDTMLAMAGGLYWSCFASIADISNPIAYPRFAPNNLPLDVIAQGRHALFGNSIDDFHLVDFTVPAEPFIADTFTFGLRSSVHGLAGNAYC
ncbi:MAG: hypothetical protein IPP40_15735 [bacterium]|nr:hypothetical protein [bacterium]